MSTPMFITFEGIDGSGKTTYMRQAVSWLHSRGVPVVATREPGGCPLSESLRSLLLDPKWTTRDGMVELLLMFAARRQHLNEVIDPEMVEGGHHVLCDRFTDSSFAYQGYGRGLDLGLIDRLDRLVTGGRRPDLTLWFDLPPEEAMRRSSQTSKFDQEVLGFHQRVAGGYRSLMERDHPERWVRFSTMESEARVWAAVKERLTLALDLDSR